MAHAVTEQAPSSKATGDTAFFRSEADALRRANQQLSHAEEALKESREHLRAIFDHSPECIKIVTPDGTLLDMNDAGCRMVGAVHQSEVIGKSIYEIIAPEDRERFKAMHARVCAGHTERLSFQIIGLDGTRHFMETHATPLRDLRTGGLNQLAITRDVTARAAAQDASQFLAAIVESSDDAVITKNLDGIITSWNKGAEWLFGYTAAEAIGRPVTMLIPGDRQGEEPEIISRIRNGQRVDHYETIRQRKDGTQIAISLTVSPVRDSQGNVIGASKVARDITGRQRTEDALRESEARFRALIDYSFLPIWVKDREGRYTMVNKRFQQIFGFREEMMQGKTDFDFFPPEIAGKLRENDFEVIRTGEPIETEETIPHSDGPHTYITVKFPIRKLDGTIQSVAGIATDITPRKEIEQALRSSEERFRTVADNISQLAWTATELGTATWYNQRWYDFTGTTFEEMREQGWESVHHPEHLERVRASIQEALRCGREWEDTFPLRGKDGYYRWFLSRAVPIRDDDGKIKCWFGTNTDITELREAREALTRSHQNLEKRVQERTASLQEAIEQMEEFSYSVSHDLRAPVRAMKGYAQAALEDYGDRLDDRGRDYLERVVRGSSRMERLIHDVLTYSRLARSEMPLQSVPLQALLPEIIQQYPAMQPPGAVIIVRAPLHSVLAHEASLTQAISNLLSNGIKFVAPGTTPRLRVWTEEKAPRKIRLWIEDNGIGIKPEYQHRLFAMFERVHQNNSYDGTGIGLAIVRKAVEKMGGTVGVQSDGITGSSFWIELPAAISQ